MATEVQSLNRALTIIETLASSPEGMGISELSRKLKLPPSTIHRLLATLSRKGFVTQFFDGKYQLGHRVVELGRTFLDNFQLTRIVRPYLEALSQKTGETANLVILDGTEAFYLDKVDSPKRLAVFSRIGHRVPLYCTAVGKVFLASMPPDKLEDYLKQTPLKRFTKNTIISPAGLRRELAEVKSSGYAFDREECEVGARCVAVPIKGLMNRTIAALSISGPAVRLNDETLHKVVQQLREVGVQITAKIH